MRVRLLPLVVCMLVFSGGFASAQDKALIGKITKKNSSVAKVMKAAGCNSSWLSQVVADSGIDPARLRKLRAGVSLYLVEGSSCKDSAPANVRSLSGVILHSYANKAAAQKLQDDLVALRNSAATTTKRLDAVMRESQSLKLQVASLAEELSKAKRAEKEAVASGAQGSNLYAVGSIGLIGILSGLAIAYGIFVWFNRKSVRFPETRKVQSAGKQYIFTLVGARETVRGSGVFVGLYKCPLCSAYDVFGRKASFIGHIATKHPEERVETYVSANLQQTDTRTSRVQV